MREKVPFVTLIWEDSSYGLIPTLEEAFRQTVPSVIVVPVDYSENMKLSAHLKEVYQQSGD